jgi:hypothetical protein
MCLDITSSIIDNILIEGAIETIIIKSIKIQYYKVLYRLLSRYCIHCKSWESVGLGDIMYIKIDAYLKKLDTTLTHNMSYCSQCIKKYRCITNYSTYTLNQHH